MRTPWSRASLATWAAKARPARPIAGLALEFLFQVGQHLALDPFQSQRRERLLEEALHTACSCPGGRDRDAGTRPGRSHRPVGDHRRVGVLLDDGVAGDVDIGPDITDPGFGGLQLPAGDGSLPLPTFQHLIVAGMRSEDLGEDSYVL